MTRLRRTAGLASAALLTFALSACGGGSEYCDLIESAEGDLGDMSEMDFTDPENIAPVQERFQEITDAAPDGVTDQWQQVTDVLGTMGDAAEDPASVDEEALADMQSMESDLSGLSENVQEECDIDMGI